MKSNETLHVAGMFAGDVEVGIIVRLTYGARTWTCRSNDDVNVGSTVTCQSLITPLCEAPCLGDRAVRHVEEVVPDGAVAEGDL